MKIRKGGIIEISIRFIFFAGTIFLALYGLITGDFRYQYLMLLGLSGVLMITGIDDFEKGKKFWSFASFGVAVFCLIVSMQVFFMERDL
ncbi:DUF3953 domain-containing protein [Salimicrobium flavidum]|uniref:DUF3953 domain-containing protein n=1 Tax=Salimicrobium flavidum TaxID=570947 RepID=A0A1N7J8J2_9BACI|nr:DUF3953 domain-containing protein [Salimicrobium flavidum]SIS45587.1 Protein of unknown function [Salimicrobium flavidum]